MSLFSPGLSGGDATRHAPRLAIIANVKSVGLRNCGCSIRERLQAADLVLSCSNFITQRTRERFPEQASRCQTLYNGVDTAFFTPNNDASPRPSDAPPRLLFVGRVSPEKGVHVLLRAFREVLRAYPDAHLTIVGPRGALPYEYSTLLSQDAQTRRLGRFYRGRLKKGGGTGGYFDVLDELLAGIRDHVSFCGSLPHNIVREHYQKADILLVPSVWHEPFGIPTIEGMACGLPVVAARSGGIPEIVVDGETGFIVERDDPNGLAAAALHLLADPGRRHAMGLAGRQRAVAHFDWTEITSQLVTWYEHILGED